MSGTCSGTGGNATHLKLLHAVRAAFLDRDGANVPGGRNNLELDPMARLYRLFNSILKGTAGRCR